MASQVQTFEKVIGPCVIKGSADKSTGRITGEFGVNLPGVGYQSIHPFAGSLHDGIGGDITVLGAHGKFIVKSEGNSVIAHLNLPTGGHEIKLLEWESHVAGSLVFTKPWAGATADYQFKSQDHTTMPNILLQCGQVVYNTGDTTLTVPVTLISTDLKKASKGGLLKGSVENRHISITLYNDETNAKIEGAVGESVFLNEIDFDGSYRSC